MRNNNQQSAARRDADIRTELSLVRAELESLKTMIKMHFQEADHHRPPCQFVKDVQRAIFSSIFAAFLALVAALINIAIAAHGG
jgi:hypothetical protein